MVTVYGGQTLRTGQTAQIPFNIKTHSGRARPITPSDIGDIALGFSPLGMIKRGGRIAVKKGGLLALSPFTTAFKTAQFTKNIALTGLASAVALPFIAFKFGRGENPFNPIQSIQQGFRGGEKSLELEQEAEASGVGRMTPAPPDVFTTRTVHTTPKGTHLDTTTDGDITPIPTVQTDAPTGDIIIQGGAQPTPQINISGGGGGGLNAQILMFLIALLGFTGAMAFLYGKKKRKKKKRKS